MFDITKFYYDIPIITRTYLTIGLLTTLACYLDFITPYQLYFDVHLIFNKWELWRFITPFVFFGTQLDLNLFLQMFFFLSYTARLENETFAGKTADYVWMIILTTSFLLIVAVIMNIQFLTTQFGFMLIYIWSKKNPWTQLQIFGLINFSAPWLPWVYLCFYWVSGAEIKSQFVGICAGHCYYFMKWVFPEITHPNKVQLIQTPKWIQLLFMEFFEDEI
eukprot:218870_1